MTDIRKAAQAVADDYCIYKYVTPKSMIMLEQALASEPSVDALIGVDDWIEAKPILFPTTESLIAEAVAKEREECAELVENLVIFHPGSADRTLDQCAEAIRARGQK